MGEPDEYYCTYCRAHIASDCDCDDNRYDDSAEKEERDRKLHDDEEKSEERGKGGFLGCGFKYVPGDPFW